uniref:Uncharacterized protein n=1 Tax=Panagrolaimus sp. JU765 TaxID=591449 RepID=A0AC34RLQ9_9BILA
MCLEDGQYARFCFRGSPTEKQRNRCNPGFCGVLSSLYSHQSKETMVDFGETIFFTREKCITFRISPSEQKVEIEGAQNKRGTCNWQRELNGVLEIYAESTLSSPIEVIGAEMFVDKKDEEEKPKTWIAAPIVTSVLVVVGLLILGIWCWKCKKDQKKDADVQKKPDTEKGLTVPRKIEDNTEEKKAFVSDSNEPVQVEDDEGRSRKASWMKREKKCGRHNEQGRCQANKEQIETGKKEAKECERAKAEPAAKKRMLDEAQQKSPSPSLSRILIGISQQFRKIAGGNKNLDITSKCCRIVVNTLVKDVINTLVCADV